MSMKAVETVLTHSRAKGTARSILVALAYHVGEDGTCWPGVSRLARLAGVSRRATYRAIAQLVALGELERESKGHRLERGDQVVKVNLYRLCGPVCLPDGATGDTVPESAPCQNRHSANEGLAQCHPGPGTVPPVAPKGSGKGKGKENTPSRAREAPLPAKAPIPAAHPAPPETKKTSTMHPTPPAASSTPPPDGITKAVWQEARTLAERLEALDATTLVRHPGTIARRVVIAELTPEERAALAAVLQRAEEGAPLTEREEEAIAKSRRAAWATAIAFDGEFSGATNSSSLP